MQNISQDTAHQKAINANSISFDLLSNPNTFKHEFELYLKDSNAYGNIYFAKHFEWQGVLREAWFSKCIFENMLALEGAFITKTAHIDYMAPVYPFESVTGVLCVENFKKVSFELKTEFYHTKKST